MIAKRTANLFGDYVVHDNLEISYAPSQRSMVIVAQETCCLHGLSGSRSLWAIAISMSCVQSLRLSSWLQWSPMNIGQCIASVMVHPWGLPRLHAIAVDRPPTGLTNNTEGCNPGVYPRLVVMVAMLPLPSLLFLIIVTAQLFHWYCYWKTKYNSLLPLTSYSLPGL